MNRCPFHEPNDPKCPRTIASQAIEFIEGAPNAREAAEIGTMAIREIVSMSGVLVKGMPR